MKKKQTKYPLKAWHDPEWQRKLSKAVTVSRVDENIPTEKQTAKRKPWYLAITQKPSQVGDVSGLPPGNTVLLSEDDVVALVRYLLEPQTAVLSEMPTVTEPGDYEAVTFLQPGMVGVNEEGEIVNGEAEWSPAYFRQQEAYDANKGFHTRKLHTLPWKLSTVKD